MLVHQRVKDLKGKETCPERLAELHTAFFSQLGSGLGGRKMWMARWYLGLKYTTVHLNVMNRSATPQSSHHYHKNTRFGWFFGTFRVVFQISVSRGLPWSPVMSLSKPRRSGRSKASLTAAGGAAVDRNKSLPAYVYTYIHYITIYYHILPYINIHCHTITLHYSILHYMKLHTDK